MVILAVVVGTVVVADGVRGVLDQDIDTNSITMLLKFPSAGCIVEDYFFVLIFWST